ncbi:zinc permease [Chloropicon primus]|uniref:Zinc permease n=1 Tax=Chloropicon primus TaxID=1764295 RepID=A0A5B8MX92_9CHLO|nr:zinc permease [Chloropicon primus]UPR03353.1 zinc permease [Chloropicon primus]|mmetsp:Transcript_12875/g.36102  ORF Transcript_12875/g.36102 Transcript_12875/m.36102 type:complete len:327 (+) Transcript_12875:217-1197(+)|eukprot:QDZ24144.1 zinc permease [Chloropicon primus]
MSASGGGNDGFTAENNVGLAFGLNILAGACTGIGAVAVVLKKDISPPVTGGILSLSAGVMVFVSFVDIYMSKSYGAFKKYFKEGQSMDDDLSDARAFQVSMASFFGGIVVTMALNYLVHLIQGLMDKRDAERGRPRDGEEPKAEVLDLEKDDGPPAEGGEGGSEEKESKQVGRVRLVKSGLIAAVAIALHNFPEGLATFMAALVDTKLGAAMAIAIAIHNIPEGMAVAMPIYKATNSRWKAILLGTLSGLTEPLGGVVGYLAVVNTGMSPLTYAIIFGIVGGMMVYISIEELLPLALKYDEENKYATKLFYVGMLIMGLSLVLFTI